MENEITRINQDNGRRLGGLLQSSNKTNQTLDETNRRLAMQNDMFSNFFRNFSRDSKKDEGNIAEEKKEAAVRERNRIASEKAAIQRENSLTKYFKSGKGSMGGAGGDGAVPVSIQSLAPGLEAAGGLFGGIIKGVLKAVLSVGGFYLVLKNMPLIVEGFKKIKEFINPTDKNGETRFSKIYKKIFSPLVEDLKSRLEGLVDAIKIIFGVLGDKFKGPILDFKKTILEVFKNFREGFLSKVTSIAESLKTIADTLGRLFGNEDYKPEGKPAEKVNFNNQELKIKELVPGVGLNDDINKGVKFFNEKLRSFNELTDDDFTRVKKPGDILGQSAYQTSKARREEIRRDEERQNKLRRLERKLLLRPLMQEINPLANFSQSEEKLKTEIEDLKKLIGETKSKEFEKLEEQQKSILDSSLLRFLRQKVLSGDLRNTKEMKDFSKALRKGDFEEAKNLSEALMGKGSSLTKQDVNNLIEVFKADKVKALTENKESEEVVQKITDPITESLEKVKIEIQKLKPEFGGDEVQDLLKEALKKVVAPPAFLQNNNNDNKQIDTSTTNNFMPVEGRVEDPRGGPVYA